MRRFLLILFAVTTAAFAQSEIVLQYDSGYADKTWVFNTDGWFFTTRFTPPEEVRLARARFYIADTGNGATFDFSIYRAGDNEPAGAIVDKIPMRVKRLGWNEIDLTSFNVMTAEDFYLSIEYDFQSEIAIGADTAAPIAGRSFDSDC